MERHSIVTYKSNEPKVYKLVIRRYLSRGNFLADVIEYQGFLGMRYLARNVTPNVATDILQKYDTDVRSKGFEFVDIQIGSQAEETSKLYSNYFSRIDSNPTYSNIPDSRCVRCGRIDCSTQNHNFMMVSHIPEWKFEVAN